MRGMSASEAGERVAGKRAAREEEIVQRWKRR